MIYRKLVKRENPRGAWVAQSVEPPTLDFGSGHDLRVVSSAGSLLGILSPSPSASHPRMRVLSLSQVNKYILKKGSKSIIRIIRIVLFPFFPNYMRRCMLAEPIVVIITHD